MFGLKALENVLSKYQSIMLLIAIVVASSLVAVNWQESKQSESQSADLKRLADELVAMNERIDHSLYSPAFEEIKFGFELLSTNSEIIAEVEMWVTNRWGSQVSSLRTLCAQDKRARLLEIIDSSTATSICRIVR